MASEFAPELARKNIAVIGMHPGLVFTELVALLRHVGFEPDAEGIADALWFAQFQAPSPARSAPPDDGSSDSERQRPSRPDYSGNGLPSGDRREREPSYHSEDERMNGDDAVPAEQDAPPTEADQAEKRA